MRVCVNPCVRCTGGRGGVRGRVRGTGGGRRAGGGGVWSRHLGAYKLCSDLGSSACSQRPSCKVCLSFLANLVQKPFKSQAVKGGDVIDLGGGHELKFIMAPNLHWPAGAYTRPLLSST